MVIGKINCLSCMKSICFVCGLIVGLSESLFEWILSHNPNIKSWAT